MKRIFLLMALCPAFAGSISGAASLSGFSLGDAANYAVLYEGNGSHNLQINSTPYNGGTVDGNIGVGNGLTGTGNPQVQLSNPAVINGNIDFANATANYHNSSGILNGAINAGVGQVTSALSTVNSLSTTLAGEAGTSLSIDTSVSGHNQTVNVSAGTIDGSGNSVFNVSSMNFQNAQTLTINGDGSHKVVFNINFNSHFSGSIVLSGGLTSDDVLFNLYGGASLAGGNTLQTAANGGTLYGVFLDPNGTINVNSVIIDGRLFGGDSTDMQIVSGATVHAPENNVPDAGSSSLLLVIGLGLLGLVRKQLLR